MSGTGWLAGAAAPLVAVAWSASAAVAAESLVLEIETLDNLGREARIQIVTPGCEDLGELSFDLHFDPDLVFANAVDGVGLLAGARVDFEAPRPGLLHVSAVTDKPVGGSGPLFELHLEAYSPEGGRSPLVIDVPRARSHPSVAGGATQIKVEAGPGEVLMRGLERSWTTLAGYLLLGLAGILVVLLVIARMSGGSSRAEGSEKERSGEEPGG